MKEWKVFYYNDKEIGAYTIHGTFEGEEQATKELLAYENRIKPEEITVKTEIR